MDVRLESDLIGSLNVPADALYGPQTQRAIQNFPVNRQRNLGSFPTLMNALLIIKKTAAITNKDIGELQEEKALAIIHAAEKLLKNPAPEQFPLHYLHGGGGTSANMNTNEVLANLGEELLGGQRGKFQLIHPNDHVNLHQSTNDVYPTACHIAILSAFPPLKIALTDLIKTLRVKQTEHSNSIHLARTCYQDAVDITFGDFFGGYVSFVARRLSHLEIAVNSLHTVNLGGTIVGRASDVPDSYMEKIIPTLRRVTGDEEYRHPESLFDSAQNADEIVNVSSQLDLLARGLIKIAQDIRVLSSGPESGLGEISIPSVQPGSSIMPGKINPVIPEFLIQTCFKVMGNHAACAAGLNHGELDLNIWESSMVFNILDSMELLESSITVFNKKCLAGVLPVVEVNEKHADSIIPYLTRLAYQYGYQPVNDICKQANGDIKLLKILLKKEFG